jgi:hypothetical protein
MLGVDVEYVGDADQELCATEPACTDFEHFGLVGCLTVSDPAHTPKSFRRGLDQEAFATAKPVLASVG